MINKKNLLTIFFYKILNNEKKKKGINDIKTQNS